MAMDYIPLARHNLLVLIKALEQNFLLNVQCHTQKFCQSTLRRNDPRIRNKIICKEIQFGTFHRCRLAKKSVFMTVGVRHHMVETGQPRSVLGKFGGLLTNLTTVPADTE
ncbi:hypothetical protein NQ318_016391 [Aromia moschata]|uniref:Uncharacterized protein n=1 Tax=Aromia moschata TaxID=1265417 RepID=A0AAV8Z3D7_9CUCU|nr:hypothetical protein NQ318_016391 [Aromia moschata]